MCLQILAKSIILEVLKKGEEFCRNFFHVTGNKMGFFQYVWHKNLYESLRKPVPKFEV